MDSDAPTVTPSPARTGGALAVAAGIIVSRITGLVRERLIAHYLGLSAAAAALRAALRIPLLLSNLLGDGALNASFIPVYARLLAEGRTVEAARVARLIGTILALAASAVAVLGVIAADPLVHLLAPGFEEGTRELTVRLVQIVFPATALLVMVSWCGGVLTCHRQFFLPYVSTVLWNTGIIAMGIAAGSRFAGHDGQIATWLAWGAVIGAAAQLLVQLPGVLRLTPRADASRPNMEVDARDGVRTVLRAFLPNVIARSTFQISAYIDQIVASFLGESIVAAMFNAQTLIMLPLSVFGIAITASELPEMSSATGDAASRAKHVRDRMEASLRWIVFLLVPSAVAFITIGGSIVALLLQTGRFDAHDTLIVWLVLAGYATSVVPTGLCRLLASSFYALGDPRPPLRSALVRVAITAGLGAVIALPLRDALHYSPTVAAFGISATSGLAGWICYAILRRMLADRIGPLPIPTRLAVGTLAAATLAGAISFGAAHLGSLLGLHSSLVGLVAVVVFSAVYLATMRLAGVPEATGIARRVLRRKAIG